MKPRELIPLMTGGTAEHRALWAEICMESDRNEFEWVTLLRGHGVIAAHPDDGWVDRTANTVQFVYPQFNDGVKIGVLVALGWPDRWRLVRLTGYIENIFGGGKWTFEALDV